MIRSEESVLITGGTGSFGHAMVRALLFYKHPPRRIIIFSRDEYKQMLMARTFNENPHLRFFLGDVRDERRLEKALRGVQYVFHAAALKQVPACEYNPREAVKTNVEGASNVIDAAIEGGVRQVVALSSDKAVNPINLYGATKLVSEKLFIAANALSHKSTRFSVVRYGNVLASRGSVVEVFRERLRAGEAVEVTHPEMTRFWWTLEDAVRFVLTVNSRMIGGEVFLPKIGSSDVMTLVKAIALLEGVQKLEKPQITGIRPGEKMHEVLVAPDEVGRTHDLGWCYAVYPTLKFFDMDNRVENPVPEYFRYSSESVVITVDQLVTMIGRAGAGNEK